jgi:hypothetical protein
MKQKIPSSAVPKSPSQVLPESLRIKIIEPKIKQAIDRIIGIQIDENEIVSAKIILQLFVVL